MSATNPAGRTITAASGHRSAQQLWQILERGPTQHNKEIPDTGQSNASHHEPKQAKADDRRQQQKHARNPRGRDTEHNATPGTRPRVTRARCDMASPHTSNGSCALRPSPRTQSPQRNDTYRAT